MSYVDGFAAPVSVANKDAYLAHAKIAWPVFEKLGALAMWECWGDDVAEGELTSFPIAVQRKDDETVVLSWTLWPSKSVRNAAWERIMTDPEIGATMGEMPFDGKRMIYGGFEPILACGTMPER